MKNLIKTIGVVASGILAIFLALLVGYLYGLTSVNTHEYHSQAQDIYIERDVELAIKLFGEKGICVVLGEAILANRIRRKDQLDAHFARTIIRTGLKFRSPEYCARGAFSIAHKFNPWRGAPYCSNIEQHSPRDIACRVGTFPTGFRRMEELPDTR